MSVTLEELDDLAGAVKALYTRKKELELQAEDASKEYNEKAFKLMTILRDHDKKKHEGAFGRISVVAQNYFKITDYDQAMQWLKDDGTYEALRKVTAADFSKRVKEVAEEDGPNKTKIVNPDLVPIGCEVTERAHLRIT